jgi:ketosteroid isomerase-like protein
MFSNGFGQANKTSPPPTAEQELKRLEDEWLNSYLRGDKQVFDRIVADDFTRTDESGKFANKAEEREIVQAPPAAVKVSLTNEDIQVRVFGDTGVITGRIVSKVEGGPSFQSRFTDTFVKRKGQWQVVARHYSRVPADPKVIDLDVKVYDSYVGKYEIMPNLAISVTKEADKLMSQTTGQPKMELLPESEIEFFIKGFSTQFVFVREETGRVTRLIINQEGQRLIARRVQ